MPMLEPILFWHWWALAGTLVIVEVFAPGIMFLWLGVAAGMVGALLLVWPGLALKGQLLVFAALSVASVLAWRRYQKTHPVVTDEPNLNRRGAGCIGQRAALATPIINGRGRLRLGDSSWAAFGPDLPAGTTVEVIGVEGTLLQVQPILTEPGETAPSSHATPPARPDQNLT
jgi:membrane protein implicated in regulation of membrane protease activity